MFNAILTINLLMLFAMVIRWRIDIKSERPPYSKTDLLDFIAVVLACFITYLLHNYIPFISSVLASAGVGLLGSLFAKDHEKAIYAGSFAGMAALTVFPMVPFAFLALVVGIVFVLTKPLFKGVGGKLGTVAFVGALFIGLLWNAPFSTGIHFNDFELFALIAIGIFAAILTRLLSNIIKISVVFSSSLVGVLLALIFDYLPFGLSPYLAICGFGASFVGMSDETQIKSLFMLGLGGLFFSIIYASGMGVLGGAGGKLGTSAFIASSAVIGLIQLFPKKKNTGSEVINSTK